MTRFSIWLVPIFWLIYGLSNAILAAPPAVGPITAVNVLYLLMLPAAVVLVWQGRVFTRHGAFPGQWPFVAFLMWVMASLAWFGSAGGAEPVKTAIVYSLLGLVAAQTAGAGPKAPRVFAAGLLATAAIYAFWTLWFALETRFAYRAGVPSNPNFVTTLIAPGLLVAVTLLLGSHRRRPAVFLLFVATLYATLLLGSRGGLLAIIGALGVVTLRLRPGWGRGVPAMAGAAAVVVLAQVPVVPDTIWTAGKAQVVRAAALMSADKTPAAVVSEPVPEATLARSSPAAVAPAVPEVRLNAKGYPVGNGGFPPPQTTRKMSEVPAPASPPAPAAEPARATALQRRQSVLTTRKTDDVTQPARRVLDSRSTAFARFGEDHVASLNLRGTLWRVGLNQILSGPGPALLGGGLGLSTAVANQANPLFANMHNAVLQVVIDFGIVGLVLLALVHWQIIRSQLRRNSWDSHFMLGGIAFFLILGLTVSAIDLHLYWVFLGVAAGVQHPEPGSDRCA